MLSMDGARFCMRLLDGLH